MSKLLVCLEEAKKKFDLQDLIDLLDQFVKEVEKLEKDKDATEERVLMHSDTIDSQRRKIKHLEQTLEVLGYRRNI